MSEVFFIKSILASNMICVLQNTNQSHCSDWGKYFSDIFNASFAFILELFIHFFFRSESSLRFHELISSFLWAYLVYLKEFFLEITVKIGIDRLKSTKETTGNTNDWPTHFFIYLIFCLKKYWVLRYSTFPRFSSSSIVLLLKFLSRSRKLTCENLSNFWLHIYLLRFSIWMWSYTCIFLLENLCNFLELWPFWLIDIFLWKLAAFNNLHIFARNW